MLHFDSAGNDAFGLKAAAANVTCSIRRRRAGWLFGCVLAAVCLACAGARAETAHQPNGESFVFGFLPAYTPEKLVITFEPLVEYLSAKLRIPMKLETAPDFPEFVQRTQHTHRYDFLFTAPHLYYLAHEKAGYEAVAQVKAGEMRAVVVVLKDSNITEPLQLAGRQVASIESLAVATVLARAKFVALGMDPERDVEIVTTPSHDASLQALLRRRTDAAVLPGPFFTKRLHPEVVAKLRILTETDAVPQMPISAAPWIPEELVAQMHDALIEMASTPDGAIVLKRIGWLGFVDADPAAYAQMERLARFANQ